MEREVPEADALEQRTPVEDEPEMDPVSDDPEVPEADALEQATPAPVDDEEED
jgi:hypothetical protein